MHDHVKHETTLSPQDERYRDMRRVTVVGGVVDLLLGVVKIFVGWTAYSQALVADGVHSLSDLATDFVVLFAAKHGSRDADTEHPYGHGRIETLATVLLGLALLLVAAGIAWDAFRRLQQPELLLKPQALALWIAAISVLSKEAIYHYTLRAANRLRSDMLRANAWHSRSDALSSIVVIIGVAGAMYGYPYMDAVAAMGVALMIAKIAWDLSKPSLHELIDTALDAERVADIEKSIEDVNGVRALHMLRTRKSGGSALVDVHILVEPTVSVSEGHQIGEVVRGKLLGEIDDITDVTVHIDPEDDEVSSPCDHLPLREEILAQLREKWSAVSGGVEIEDVTLHYLDGKVHLDVILPLAQVQKGVGAQALARAMQETAASLADIGTVRVLFH